MVTNLKPFAWLAYAAIAANLLSEMSTKPGTGGTIASAVVTLILALLVWLAANRRHIWAAGHIMFIRCLRW